MKQLGTSTSLKGQEDWANDLQELFIGPLTSMGAKFLGYAEVHSDELPGGAHVLIFDNVSREGFKYLEENPYEDDSQPESSYQAFLDTAWVFIPYVA